MIRKVSFRNFKALRHVDVELERLTVIVGPNASGKTSILDGLRLLARAAKLPPAQLFRGRWDIDSVRSVGATGDMELAVSDDYGGFRLRASPPQSQPPGAEPRWSYAFEKTALSEQNGHWQGIAESSEVLARVPSARLLRFDVQCLAAPSYIPRRAPRVSEHGRGLASALAYMKLTREEEFQHLQQALQSVVPSVRRIRFDRASLTRTEPETVTIGADRFTRRVQREYWADTLVFDVAGANGVPAHMMSEGTLLVLGLLTVLTEPSPPILILLDDIERGLHPKAQEALVRLLRKFLDQCPRMQLVVTSHSPYLLDDIKAEEVRFTALTEDGSVVCGRLDEHPQFDRWKKEMTPGEFWSHVGEKWIADRQLTRSR
jgi:energy-coupling factor transporter ATP-binding protein EcfA2